MPVHRERPAPGRLELLRAFVNTRDIDEKTDALSSPEELGVWLVEHGLLDSDASVAARDVALAVDVREAFRMLLIANAAGETPATEAISRLNTTSRACALAPRLDANGRSTITTPKSGPEGAIGTLLAVMHEEIATGRWARLKACLEHSCRWAFYDHSRNCSSHWCTMGECGNRNKNRAYYARKRERAT